MNSRLILDITEGDQILDERRNAVERDLDRRADQIARLQCVYGSDTKAPELIRQGGEIPSNSAWLCHRLYEPAQPVDKKPAHPTTTHCIQETVTELIHDAFCRRLPDDLHITPFRRADEVEAHC